MKTIGILGSTGSIGTQTLEVLNHFPNEFEVKYLTAHDNVQLLAHQAKTYNPDTVCIINESKLPFLKELLKNTQISIVSGRNALLDIASRNDVDLVINALVGADGMEPTINAIKSGADVALSNKESMVMAGEIINDLIKTYSCNLYPVDSEHNAIWQCLQGENICDIKKIILTGSGGPFRTKPAKEFHNIKIEEALNHPNWDMGNKITIDSATMMNKGLEVIEAYWLFNLSLDQIEIIIHPESIIHSMVEFIDGSIKAQLGVPDMKIPIQYALTYPKHAKSNWKTLDLTNIGSLNFEKPDLNKFPCIKLAYSALEEGGSNPIVLNIANDIVVDAFLNEKILFTDIPTIIEQTISQHDQIKCPSLEDIMYISDWTKQYVNSQLLSHA